MKRLIALLALFAFVFVGLGAKAVHVRGYTRKDGAYVAPHVPTSPNHTKSDNYSTLGNVNPYTGKEGTKPGHGAANDAAARTTPSENSATSPRADSTKETKAENAYWITTKSGIRHNSKCRYFRNSQGAPCTKNEGRACKICGG